MLTSVKIYLVFCLIGLQFIAPFIHAHALDLDSTHGQSVHFHVSALPLQGLPLEASIENHVASETATSQTQAGYIVTVASGIKPKTDADLMLGLWLGMLLLTAIVLSFLSSKPIFNLVWPLCSKRLIYPLQNPRAPPRSLNL